VKKDEKSLKIGQVLPILANFYELKSPPKIPLLKISQFFCKKCFKIM
jgi:hypothetical protein